MQANCRKYWAVLTSAFSHFANANSRDAVTQDATHTTPYR